MFTYKDLCDVLEYERDMAIITVNGEPIKYVMFRVNKNSIDYKIDFTTEKDTKNTHLYYDVDLDKFVEC